MAVLAADCAVRVLSVRQPWAWAIVAGLKDVENRSWQLRWRGLLLVHASLRDDPAGWQFLARHGIEAPDPRTLPRGKIVGAMAIGEVTRGPHPSIWAQPRLFHWSIGAVATADRPIAATGQVGLWPAPAGWRDAFDGLQLTVATVSARAQHGRLF